MFVPAIILQRALTWESNWAGGQGNGEPSSARWQYWSQIKDVSFCFEKIAPIENKKQIAFHLGPVEPPSSEGSPLIYF